MTFPATPYTPLAANHNERSDFHDHHTETDAWLSHDVRRAEDRDFAAGRRSCGPVETVLFAKPGFGGICRSDGRAGSPKDRIAGLIIAFLASVAFWGSVAAVFLGVRP